MQATLDRIAALNPTYNAIVSLRDGDDLLRRGRRAATPNSRAASAAGWMHGMPQAIKDLAPRRPASARTLGSPLLADHVPDARRADGRADEGGRLHRHRQDQHARVRARLAHLQRGVRRHAQRLRPHASRPAAAAAAPRSRWRRTCCRSPTAATSWAACATRRPGTTSSASGRARAACRAGRRATSGSRSSAPKGRWGARCATSPLLLDVQAGYDARAPLSHRDDGAPFAARRSMRSTPRGAAHRLARRPRRPPARWSPASSTSASAGCAGSRRSAAAVEPTPLGFAPERVWDAWLVWRRWLRRRRASRRTCADPANRALIKPEALWEHDQGAQLTGAQTVQAVRRAHRLLPAAC